MLKTYALTAFLLLVTCEAAEQSGPGPRWERERVANATASKGEVLWLAPGPLGHEVLVVTFLPNGKVEVYANPAKTYQRARDCGYAFDHSLQVCTDWLEVFSTLPENGAAQGIGWRNPSSRHYYALQVFPGAQGRPLRMPNPASGIDSELRIFQRGTDAFLVVITTTNVVTPLMSAVEAGGDGL